MIPHAVHVPKKPFRLEHLDDFFEQIIILLKIVIPILFALMTMVIYVFALPLSILTIIFIYINKKYNKKLPSMILIVISSLCWVWLSAVALFN